MNSIPTVLVINPPPQPQWDTGSVSLIDYVVKLDQGDRWAEYQFRDDELGKAVDFMRSQPDEADATLHALGVDSRGEKFSTRLRPNGRWTSWEECS